VFVSAVSEPVPLRFVAAGVRADHAPAGSFSSPERVWIDSAPESVDGASGSVRSVREDPNHIELEVEASRPTALVVLDGAFPGWHARLGDRSVPILSAGAHRAVWIPAGRSRVAMDYRPPGLRSGLLVMVLSVAALAVLWRRRGRTP